MKPPSYLNFPYRVNANGRTDTANYVDHVRQQIEQILFTAPGERPNRPTFGSGLRQLLFAPNSDLLTQTTQVTVQAALQQWMGDRIHVVNVETRSDDSTLYVSVVYRLAGSLEEQTETFKRAL